MGTVGLKDVCNAGRGAPLMFFQLYVLKDREFTKMIVQGVAMRDPCSRCSAICDCLVVCAGESWCTLCDDRSVWCGADAEKAGYNFLVVTVDSPFLGNREADVRNG